MVDVNSQRIINRSLEGNDHSTLFQVIKWLCLGGIFLAVVITSAAVRKEIRELKYQIEDLNDSNAKLVVDNDLLRVEYNSITAPQELEKASLELGLISSNSAEILTLDVESLKTARGQMAMTETQDGVLRE